MKKKDDVFKLNLNPKKEICKNCGKEKGEHKLDTFNCPSGRSRNFPNYYPNQFFELKASKTKKKVEEASQRVTKALGSLMNNEPSIDNKLTTMDAKLAKEKHDEDMSFNEFYEEAKKRLIQSIGSVDSQNDFSRTLHLILQHAYKNEYNNAKKNK